MRACRTRARFSTRTPTMARRPASSSVVGRSGRSTSTCVGSAASCTRIPRSRRPGSPPACSVIPRSAWRGSPTSSRATGSRSSRAISCWRARLRAWCSRTRATRCTPTSARSAPSPCSSCNDRKIDAASNAERFGRAGFAGVWALRRPRGGLSRAADYPCGRLHAGWGERRARPHPRPQARANPRPAARHRQPPGAGGNVAAEAVAHAAPDGYTLFNGNNAILATNAALYKKINFDPEADFAPIGLIGSQANILVVNPALPAKSMAELIALAKANPGKLNFASSGHGLAAHLAGELFKAEAKIDIVHVPYKGAAPALQDVIAGHVQMMFATASSVVPHIRD